MTNFTPLTRDETVNEVRAAIDVDSVDTITQRLRQYDLSDAAIDRYEDIRQHFIDDFVGTAPLRFLTELPGNIATMRDGWITTRVEEYLIKYARWPEDIAKVYVDLAGWDHINLPSGVSRDGLIAVQQRAIIEHLVRSFVTELFDSVRRNDYYESLIADIDHHLGGVIR